MGNLPSNIDERDLEDIFYKYGDIADVDLKIPRYGTGGTPFAFVEFHDPRYVEMKFHTSVKLPLLRVWIFHHIIFSVSIFKSELWFQFRRRFIKAVNCM